MITTLPQPPAPATEALIKRKAISLRKPNLKKISPQEDEYLFKWLRREGMNNVYKHRNAPEILLSKYKKCVADNNKTFKRDSPDYQRLDAIEKYIDFITNILPKYTKFLKLHNLKSYEVGLTLGYKNASTWHDSYKKFTYIRFLVSIITMHEKKLAELK